VLLDLRIHFVKANGKPSPKVFKLRTVTLEPGRIQELRKTVSLAELTTRKHYPGNHDVEALVNGKVVPLGSFQLIQARGR
jgi:hypothetical protein